MFREYIWLMQKIINEIVSLSIVTSIITYPAHKHRQKCRDSTNFHKLSNSTVWVMLTNIYNYIYIKDI